MRASLVFPLVEEEQMLEFTPSERYRRQSFHTSAAFPSDHLVRWNKSFADFSVVYGMHPDVEILSGFETLPNES